MGNSTLLTFDDRTRRFKRERKRMARGYKTVVRPDGLIVYRPKRSAFSFVPPKPQNPSFSCAKKTRF